MSDLDDEFDRLSRLKENAVGAGDFELAAQLREQAARLRRPKPNITTRYYRWEAQACNDQN